MELDDAHPIDSRPPLYRWTGTKDNYTTSVVGNASVAFIRKSVADGKPFFAYVAPKAAHEPFIPAPCKWSPKQRVGRTR